MAANRPAPGDALGAALAAYLTGTAEPLDEQSLSGLSAGFDACALLTAAGYDGLPTPEQHGARIDRLRLLEPFEHIAGDFFRGRRAELRCLHEHVVEGGLPLVVHGPGGVGKSSLVARFLLEHAQQYDFAYLDFDRPDVDPSQPLTLLLEALRQLGIQHAPVRPSFEDLREDWRTSRPSLSAAIEDFTRLLQLVNRGPFVLVLDTFEEVQYHSGARAEAVWELLDRLTAGVDALRVIIVGRAPLPDDRPQLSLPLSGLDEEAATAYLMALGVDDPALAHRVFARIGGSPMNLKLAADLVSKVGPDLLLDAETRDLAVDQGVIQRQLHVRVLNHIHDPEVRKLAHPGLVLRRLTPELILAVLAEPCGLAARTPAEAGRLFDELRREVALVDMVADGSLRHRPDLRRATLPLLQADEPALTRQISERAVAYYAERPERDPRERAEELYHRLVLDQDRDEIDARWLDGAEGFLHDSLGEFSGARLAYLASRLGVVVDAETEALADLEDWERVALRRATEELELGKPVEALKVLNQRDDRTASSPLYAIHATALARLDLAEDAVKVCEAGIERAVEAGDRPQALALAVLQGELILSVPWVGDAMVARRRLQALAEGAAADAALRAAAIRFAIEPDADVAAEVRARFDALPDTALRDDPPLAFFVGAVLNRDDVARWRRILTLIGLPRDDESAVRLLGSVIASFDLKVSKERGELPGALARGAGIEIFETLSSSWGAFLLTAEPRAAGAAIIAVLEEGSLVPHGMFGSLASTMDAAALAGLRPPRPETVRDPAQVAAELDERLRERLMRALADAFPTAAICSRSCVDGSTSASARSPRSGTIPIGPRAGW